MLHVADLGLRVGGVGKGLLHYLGGELFVEEGSVHGEEGFVAAVLDGAFAVTVDEDGALLGLGVRDAADVDE